MTKKDNENFDNPNNQGGGPHHDKKEEKSEENKTYTITKQIGNAAIRTWTVESWRISRAGNCLSFYVLGKLIVVDFENIIIEEV